MEGKGVGVREKVKEIKKEEKEERKVEGKVRNAGFAGNLDIRRIGVMPLRGKGWERASRRQTRGEKENGGRRRIG